MSAPHGKPLIHLLAPGWFEAQERYVEIDTGHDTPCWIWTMAHTEGGYGGVTIRAAGRLFGTVAHRLYYEREHGPVPPGLQLDHLCRVRSCVNPAHLEAVTPAENFRRARLATGGYKLDADSVLTIRAKGASTRALARKFGISQSLVRNVQAGRSYAWVTA